MSTRKTLPPDLKRPRPGVEPNTPEWLAWTQEISDYLGYTVCGHKTRAGTPCALEPMAGRTRCKHAGGKTLRGPEHPNWRTGRHSQVAALLPGNLREKYESLVTDPKLLALESDIALVDLRQQQLLEAMSGADPVGAITAAQGHLADMRVAMAEGDVARVDELLANATAALARGADAGVLWDDWMDAAEQKRKLADSEGRRMERMGQYMTVEQVRTYNAMVISIFKKAAENHVPLEYRTPFLQQVLMDIAFYSGMSPKPQTDPTQLPAHEQHRNATRKAG